MQDIAVLKQARALLAAGWVQNSWEVRYPRQTAVSYCLGGAIYAAAGMPLSVAQCPAIRALNWQAFGVDSYEVREIVMFNDTPGRTKDEVLALLDAAIVNLEAGVFVKRLHYAAPAKLLNETATVCVNLPPYAVFFEDTPLGIVSKKLHVERELSVVDSH